MYIRNVKKQNYDQNAARTFPYERMLSLAELSTFQKLQILFIWKQIEFAWTSEIW